MPPKNPRKSIEDPKYLGCKPQPLKGLLMTLNAYAVSPTPTTESLLITLKYLSCKPHLTASFGLYLDTRSFPIRNSF